MKNVPDFLRYALSHEWVKIEDHEDQIATVGITDHAQAELTDIVFVEPPPIGVVLKAGSAAAVVESVKAASDIYSPVSGTVTEINPLLDTQPELLNTDPFGQGWIFKIRLSHPEELDTLQSPETYRQQIAE